MTLRAIALAADLFTDDRRSITEATDFAARLARPLHRRLAANDHDLVVASVFPYFPVLASKFAALGTDIPLVTTWHKVWREYWESYLGGAPPFGKAIEHVTACLLRQPIAVSGITTDRFAETGPVRESIDVVPNGIDVDCIQSAPLHETHGHDAYDVLFAGRLIEDKNVTLLLDAFDGVADRSDATLRIIGDRPEAD